jgi:CubicO group peptidase (beta-lactamase class C family)
MRSIRHAVALLFVATSAFAQDTARMEQVIDTYVKNRTFMGAVLVANGDTVLLSKGYGSANLEWEIPNTPSTKFRLGSLTKQFTAASILLLEERGKLSTSDPIKKHIPDAPKAWDAITIHQLLTHTSGIPNFTSFPEFPAMRGTASTVDKTITLFRDKPLDFPAGEKMDYSNSGYLVLGHLIEKLSGGSYDAFVQANLFAPLGMADSGYDSNSRIIARRASGYVWSPDRYTNADHIDMSVPHAAGALYSTTGDLLKWERALLGGKVLSAASLAKMLTPANNNYAYGVSVQAANGRKAVMHGGAIDGFHTFMATFPDSGVTVIVLGNANNPSPEQLAAQLVAIAHGETARLPTERKEIPLPAAAATYAGVYELTPALTMTITLKGSQMFAQLTGQGAIPIFAESDTNFFVKVVDAQISFGGEGGAITHLVLHQNGRDLKATRRQP